MLSFRLATYGKYINISWKRALSTGSMKWCNSMHSFPSLSQYTSLHFFSTVVNQSSEPSTQPSKKLLETRSDDQNKIVKNYLSLINMCDLRKFYYAEETKKLLKDGVVLFPGELSSSISYMYRIGLSKLVLQVYRAYEKKGLFGLLNVTSLKYVMLCCAIEKDSKLLHSVYDTLSPKRKNSIVLNSTYIRCLLSLNDLTSATTILSSYLSNPAYTNTTVLSKNDIYSNVIVGFYEGKYYSRCLKSFYSLKPSTPTSQTKDPSSTIHEENWKSIQNSLCYSAVIGSCYRLNDSSSVLHYYDECRKIGQFPNFLESMMVAQTYASSDDYKLIYNTLVSKKEVLRGIPEMEKERYLINLSQVKQMRKALQQVYWSWHYYRNQKPKFEHETNSINTYVGDNGDVGNALQVVATLYDLKTFSPKDLTSTKIVVKTGSNTIGMKQIVDYLEKDVYPILPYEIINNRILMNVSDVQLWVKTRRNLSLELR